MTTDEAVALLGLRNSYALDRALKLVPSRTAHWRNSKKLGDQMPNWAADRVLQIKRLRDIDV